MPFFLASHRVSMKNATSKRVSEVPDWFPSLTLRVNVFSKTS